MKDEREGGFEVPPKINGKLATEDDKAQDSLLSANIQVISF